MATRRRGRRWRLKRRTVQRATVLLAIACVVGAIALFSDLYGAGSPTSPPAAAGGAPPASGSGPAAGFGGPAITSSASGKPRGSSLLQNFPAQLTSKLGGNYLGEPGHTVVLTVFSTGSIARLGYLVPTAAADQEGDQKNVAGGWTKTIVAHGPYGPFAAIFIQTDSAGTPVFCSVTIDGVLKDSHTYTGRFTQGLCYG